nr:MAG TPA: hypothetical protein [Caudoviricetes sp.]
MTRKSTNNNICIHFRKLLISNFCNVNVEIFTLWIVVIINFKRFLLLLIRFVLVRP